MVCPGTTTTVLEVADVPAVAVNAVVLVVSPDVAPMLTASPAILPGAQALANVNVVAVLAKVQSIVPSAALARTPLGAVMVRDTPLPLTATVPPEPLAHARFGE